MNCIGYGKVILLGEHAVVYGYPALAAALDRGITMAPVATRAGTPLRLEIPAWNVNVIASDDHSVARSLSAVADALGAGRPPLSLIGDAKLPAGSGFGSSGALAVAVARALIQYLKLPGDDATVTRAADASEALVHGTASGVDVALARSGGIGVFRRATGLVPLDAVAPLRVLVGPTWGMRSTAAMVKRVADATGGDRDDPRLAELGALTEGGIASLRIRDLPALGAAMNRAHQLLGELGVSTPQLDMLCNAARSVGALGAKLTGAGGGGAVIAIAPAAREQAVLDIWQRTGITGFATTVAGARLREGEGAVLQAEAAEAS
jgi:mevalonate kinase